MDPGTCVARSSQCGHLRQRRARGASTRLYLGHIGGGQLERASAETRGTMGAGVRRWASLRWEYRFPLTADALQNAIAHMNDYDHLLQAVLAAPDDDHL